MKGRRRVVNREQAVTEGRQADWVVLTEGRLWSLTSRHCLDSTPCVYNTTTERRGGGGRKRENILSLNNLNQASCFFKCCLFVPSLLTFIINYPATPWQHNEVPRLMMPRCIKFWVWCKEQSSKARLKAPGAQFKPRNQNTISSRWDSPDSYLILRLQMKLRLENTTWPVIYPKVHLQANTKQGECDIFQVAYLHKGLEPPPCYVKCLLHSLAFREYQRKCLYGGSPCVSPKDTHLYSKAGVYALHALRYFL